MNRNFYLAGCLAGALTCAPDPATASQADTAEVERADRFLVVDCLLPGQVRRLGRQVTYMTARRAIRTSASDCEIRGGEYTAYDRANYATALKIWLPLARDGDARAQNYVGEIYEKGLGTEPQYDLAVEWYRRAAEQGLASAQINLGAMFERGLGVPRDKARAVELYRRASGLGAANLAYVPGDAGIDIDALRAERDALARERDALDARLSGLEDELAGARAALERRERDANAALREMQAARAELEQLRLSSAETDDEAHIAELEAALALKDAEVEARAMELSEIHERVAALNDEVFHLSSALANVEAAAREPVEAAATMAAAPSIEIIEPPLDRTGDQADLAVTIPVAAERVVVGRVDAPGGLVTLIINDAEHESRDGIFRVPIAVAYPETPVRIAAIDGLGQRTDLNFLLRPDEPLATQTAASVPAPQPQIQFGSFHALIIGNNDYPHMRNLETAVSDARAVDELLRNRYGFETTLLLNADRYAILSTLNRLRETLDENSNLLIYYAGHGAIDRVNDRGHWLPVDAESGSTANWISNIQITDALNAMTVRQVMVVADSCYSGSLTRAALAQLDGAMSDDARATWIELMAEKRARVVLTSGGVQPVVDRGGRGEHSAFASAFLDVLARNNEILEGQRVYHSVAERMSGGVAARVGQTPQYAPIKFAGHEAGDFFFVPSSS